MSRAFVKESDQQEPEPLPDRPISPHRNWVTAEGRADLDRRVAELEGAAIEARRSGDKSELVRLERDLRYFSVRRASAEVVPAPRTYEVVQFGSRVSIRREDGRSQQFRIVGEDEADPKQGKLSYVSPMARAILGLRAGDTVVVAGAEVEVESIERAD